MQQIPIYSQIDANWIGLSNVIDFRNFLTLPLYNRTNSPIHKLVKQDNPQAQNTFSQK